MVKFKLKLKRATLFWKTNEAIRVPELRVIGDDGKQLGVLKTPDALKLAREKNLTLVEVASNAKPPVAKIVEFGKFRYQEEKRIKKISQKQKGTEVKEIRFSPFIADNDFQTRLDRVREFLEDKDKVRLVVVFKGPQMRSRQFGYSLLDRIQDELGEGIAVDMKPKFLGKHLMMVISPTGKIKKLERGKDNAKTENKEISTK